MELNIADDVNLSLRKPCWQLALDSVDVKFVRNPLLWLFKNPVDFIKRNFVGFQLRLRPALERSPSLPLVRACTDAHRPWTPRALPRPPDRTQGYHEPPYRGLPLHCCGIDHAFLDR
ncbi:hypothetical protein J6590_083244 [Homalodisca vitripennis]|nr:hypothetical protein J6590_083244 [Homalodisca vitripennis]